MTRNVLKLTETDIKQDRMMKHCIQKTSGSVTERTTGRETQLWNAAMEIVGAKFYQNRSCVGESKHILLCQKAIKKRPCNKQGGCLIWA